MCRLQSWTVWNLYKLISSRILTIYFRYIMWSISIYYWVIRSHTSTNVHRQKHFQSGTWFPLEYRNEGLLESNKNNTKEYLLLLYIQRIPWILLSRTAIPEGPSKVVSFEDWLSVFWYLVLYLHGMLQIFKYMIIKHPIICISNIYKSTG